MPFSIPFISSTQRHSRIASQDQDDELDAAFSGEDSSPSSQIYDEITDSTARTTLPDSPPAPNSHSLEPSSPAPLYDEASRSFLSEPSETSPPDFSTISVPSLPYTRRPRSSSRPWRDWLTATFRYGRLSTGDPSSNPDSHLTYGHNPYGSGLQNDGVFGNLVAKPESQHAPGIEYVGGDDDVDQKESPPSYDTAAADSAPPYWETTILTPSGYLGPDDILVDGLPVGNLFSFAWNLLVSMSFQFVGFLLTYLLHTTHAAKNGSRAGLGITLIQWAFYMRTRAAQLQEELDNGEFPPELLEGNQFGSDGDSPDGWSLWGTPPNENDASVAEAIASALGATPTATTGESLITASPSLSPGLQEAMRMSSVANDWLSYALMILGWALIIGSVLNYLKAVRWARAIRNSNSAAATSSAPTETSIDHQILVIN